MGPFRRRDAVAALIIATLAGILVALPGLDPVRGLSLDVLTALRWRAFGHNHDPNTSPTVVVALDEETYRTPPFVGTPNVTWTGEIGRVLLAVADGGAKVVGFDIIFPTSIEQSQVPFGEETLGAKVRGFDRDFLRALALTARADKVVLGQLQHQDEPILPSPGQRAAVGQQRNIRALNLHNDPDDVVRRIPLTLQVDNTRTPSFALELAARALGTTPDLGADATVALAGYQVPSLVANTMTLNFDGGVDDIPTYSLADLRACAEKNDQDFFRRAFAGKVVLIGTVLDVEDRKITSKRFATKGPTGRVSSCTQPRLEPWTQFIRDSIPGVYIHATAINNLVRRDALLEIGTIGRTLSSIAMALMSAIAVLLLAPISATLAFLGLVAAWIAGGTFALRQAVALPLVEPLVAGFLTLTATTAYRFVLSDRDKRLLRNSFALYLAPSIIEKMMASNKPPMLGGETRTITVFFSDVAGFSSFSEKMSPSELVALMNEYLSAMTDIIQEHGGFVDKYIGDAITAVFGAPLDDPQHATNAVRAALRCRERLEELNQSAQAFRGHKLGHRIGLNTGDALVGNIGSRQRFNYTVMGDAVNLASRLEGANKYFATSIMAAQATVEGTGSTFAWRELDSIVVQGRSEPVRIYEPLALAGMATREQTEAAQTYAKGLACWRARDFAGAAEHFARLAEVDPPAARFLARAQAFLWHPPGPDWAPINTLEGK